MNLIMISYLISKEFGKQTLLSSLNRNNKRYNRIKIPLSNNITNKELNNRNLSSKIGSHKLNNNTNNHKI